MLDATTGRESLVLRHANVVSCVTFSPDGQRIMTGSWDQAVKVWDATSGRELLVLKGHTARVRSLVCSPDGKRIVTGSDDRMAKVWDMTTGQELLALKESQDIWSVAFSPDRLKLFLRTSESPWCFSNDQQAFVELMVFLSPGDRIIRMTGCHWPFGGLDLPSLSG